MKQKLDKVGTYLFGAVATLAVPSLLALPFTYGSPAWELNITLVLILALVGAGHAALNLFVRASINFSVPVFLVIAGAWASVLIAQLGGATGEVFGALHLVFAAALTLFVVTRFIVEAATSKHSH